MNRNRPDQPRQLPLGLPASPPRFDRAHYVEAESNRSALAAAAAFFLSDEPVLCVSGPPQSGKSHFLAMLARERGGGVIDAAALVPGVDAAGVVAVDNAGRGAASAMIALFEGARGAGGKVLIAGAGKVEEWAGGSRDLETRLGAAPRIALEEPGENLLVAVIAKQLADRQLRAGPEIARYVAPRLPKTFAAAADFVSALDALALELGAAVSLRLARKVIDNLSEAPFAPYSLFDFEEDTNGGR